MKNETKHTPGPWKLIKTSGEISLVGNNERRLLASWDTASDGIAAPFDDEDSANLVLIASAPDLLKQRDELVEVLEGLLRTGPSGIIGQQTARENAIAVIASVKGEK